MTGKEKKRAQYKRLIVEIKEDLNATQRIARDISNIVRVLEAEKGSVRGSDLMACAGYLHHYFTACESIFERISRAFDGGLVQDGDYHRELLRSMTLEIPDLRPKIISKDLAEELDEYRRFRHMFRHAYGSELRWRKMEPLAMGVETLTLNLLKELSEFLRFIDKLSDSIAR
ncbi:ribonuclease toxin HepT-like protein [Desulfosporosinus fructosivorans]